VAMPRVSDGGRDEFRHAADVPSSHRPFSFCVPLASLCRAAVQQLVFSASIVCAPPRYMRAPGTQQALHGSFPQKLFTICAGLPEFRPGGIGGQIGAF
jgi:hypothetical protein